MMTCLDERRLLDLHAGDGTATDRAHAAGCVTCAARLRALARDLARIDTVLRETVAPRRTARAAPAWRWAPVAVAAALALVVAVYRLPRTPVAPDDDTLALVDELAGFWTYDALLDDEAAARSSQARSTCTWGDPLLGVGCDEPTDMQIAWR